MAIILRYYNSCYISGPISGMPLDVARHKFTQARTSVKDFGYIPVNPMTFSLPPRSPWLAHMTWDVLRLLFCHNIYMMRGWRKSRGAVIERKIAVALMKNIIYQQ